MVGVRFVKWLARKFQATVLNDIWFEVVFFTGIATSMIAFNASLGSSLKKLCPSSGYRHSPTY